MKNIIIIGGGASGMMAAISASRHGAKVTILEHTDRIGRKILSTGNGKCNYTNRKQGLRYYRGENPAFVLPVFSQFGFEETIDFFHELGIFPKEKNGYFYPAGEQAAAVLEVLRLELSRLFIHIVTECEIQEVKKTEHGFCITSNQGIYKADCCIFACGLKAFPKSGSDGSACFHIEKLGHSLVDVVPALVQLKAKQSFFKSLAGIRSDINVSLYVDERMVCQDRGEVQLTDYGISGIPTFQVSRYAARALNEKRPVKVLLDFAPFLTADELEKELKNRFYQYGAGKTCGEVLLGLFPGKLIPLFFKQCQISIGEQACRISKKKLKELSGHIKQTTIDIVGTKGFEHAQVCAGGVNTYELNPDTLESALVEGLYFAGEVIDIDGMCGGYNLQWAWSSGYVSGMHAALS